MFKTFKALKEFLKNYENLNLFNEKLLETSKTLEEVNSRVEVTRLSLEKNLIQSNQLNKIILNLEEKTSFLDELNGKILNYQKIADEILSNKETLNKELKEIKIIKNDNNNLKNNIETIKNEYTNNIEELKREHFSLNEDMEKLNSKTNELNTNIINLLESLNNVLD
ncbi:hypothetical protein [Cetobacterium sp.]|uniref:hypothetical protein n=1 Tax=Cetobacterium sp. TaxID=2071632 RepID=UPI003EE45D10